MIDLRGLSWKGVGQRKDFILGKAGIRGKLCRQETIGVLPRRKRGGE